LIGYILITAFALVINFGSISTRTIIADVTNVITFLVVYFCSKKYIDKKDFTLFQIAILSFAAISAVVSIYQFFVNPEFFRLGVTYGAFLDYYRSNGLFTTEYDQGIFLIMSIIVAMSMNIKWWIKIVFITICSTGVFLTMHRLSWVAMVITFGLIWYFYMQKNIFTNIIIPLLLLILVFGALNVPWSQMAIGKFGYGLITDRILADTLSIRFSQYIFSFDMIPKYPLGIGSYSNPIYDQEALNQGIPFTGSSSNPENHAYVIHNGSLSAGVKYGILGLILFSLFFFTSAITFLGKSIQKNKNWYPLLLIIVVFMVFNLTNDFSFFGTQIGVAISWLLGGYIAVINDNEVAQLEVQPNK
jgi:hypothetical protein